jgi:hypothetical protein
MGNVMDSVFSHIEETENKAEAWDYYQNLIKSEGFEGITQLLVEVKSLRKQLLELESAIYENV